MSGDKEDREMIRFFHFSGEDDDWNEWKKKALAFAETKGYIDAFFNDYSQSSVTEERVQNVESYNLLMMCCKDIAFGIVEREKRNAKVAWSSLVKVYESSNEIDLMQLDKEFVARQ